MAGIYVKADELCEVVGDAAALQLLTQFGGGCVYIPAKLADDHPLVQLIGLDAAEALVKEYTHDNVGVRIQLPRSSTGLYAQSRNQVAQAVKEGGRASDIARRIGITTRTVTRERRRQRQEPDDSQGDLF